MSDLILRSVPLEDISIDRGGDHRTVTAYAAVFDTDTEVKDQHGHYIERNHSTAFNRTVKNGLGKVQVFYNHGMTIHGTPSERGSIPIGVPVEITADRRGLKTVTRYNKTALADDVLESIRNNEIRGYSYTGRIIRSEPQGRVPRTRPGQPLPTVVRMELGLQEYGPTPMPYYETAEILSVRASLLELNPEERAYIARLCGTDLVARRMDSATANPAPGTDDPPSRHSARNRRAIHMMIAERLGVQ